MNPRKTNKNHKRTSKKKLKDTQILAVCVTVISLIIMISFLIHNYNVKNYVYIKSDKGKDLVYTQYLKEDKNYTKEVPYININGPQIIEVNNQIKAFSTKYTELNRAMLTYECQLNGDILSVILKAISYETDYASKTEFLSFNINIETQQVLNHLSLLNLFGIDESYVEKKIETQLRKHYNEIVKQKYYSANQCNFACFLDWRDIDDYLEKNAYYVDSGKLYVYKPFVFESIFGEEEYFKDEDFIFLIKE